MITNLNYLKTAVETLEEGQTEITELKILKVMQQICQQNIEQIENAVLDRINTSMGRQAQDIRNIKLVDMIRDS